MFDLLLNKVPSRQHVFNTEDDECYMIFIAFLMISSTKEFTHTMSGDCQQHVQTINWLFAYFKNEWMTELILVEILKDIVFAIIGCLLIGSIIKVNIFIILCSLMEYYSSPTLELNTY